ncbi:MAG TPA: PilZ domain-containing protein [Fimbriimonadaceae bacterium]|nr:PilZ domain-containing protein [Fimbriimonadaceae bacterium]
MSFANFNAPGSHQHELYIERRARLQRVDDNRPFHGWVEEVRDKHVRVRLGPSFEKLSPGDHVSVEVAGKEHTASFVAEVLLTAEWLLELEICGEVSLLPRKENPRVNMFGERCKVYFGEVEMNAISVDISERGLGLVVTGNIEPGTQVEFECNSQLGLLGGKGVILYCKADPFSQYRFRAGLEVTELADDDQERWTLLQDFPATPW